MFRCFVDDSGKDSSEAVFVLGAWCGPVSAMEMLSGDYDDFVRDFNVGLATDILANIKAEREGKDGKKCR